MEVVQPPTKSSLKSQDLARIPSQVNDIPVSDDQLSQASSALRWEVGTQTDHVRILGTTEEAALNQF